MASWNQAGNIGNLAQLAGLDAAKLISMIVIAANTARMHKRNCRQFAQHLKLIGNLLEQLRISELKKYPETREPLEQLEEALRRSYILVNSCQDRSYLYLLAMGWNIVYQFKRAQNEIDRYLRLVPLITLVDNARVREKLEYIARDEREYTLDEEDKQVQNAILSRDPSTHDTMVVKKSLSCSYNLSFDKALKKENEKLQLELQRSQTATDPNEREVIHHLIGVTETVANSVSERSSCQKNSKSKDPNNVDYYKDREKGFDNPREKRIKSRSEPQVSSGKIDWHSDLLDCCAEPYLCVKTLFFPCGTFSKIATVADNKEMSSAEACNDLMAYSLVLSCCCYTCCVRKKLRKLLSIKGGCCDDFLSHLMCCCCALVQEWREVEIRGAYYDGKQKAKTSPPSIQYMES